MSATVMSLKTDAKLKEDAQRLAKRMGFSLGTLINAFLRQFTREKTVSFSMEPQYKMSKTLEKRLKKIEEDIKSGRNLSPEFDNIKDAIEYLDNAKIR